ncbi:ABC transporter permease [Paenibacillus alginolyticus]|uniref:ABC transporter permease n=1 Tax=Paenibacillus alginolyticus TaxID=59839 RepID=A0ABT4GMS5_9BACL|nr:MULTISPECIES: ABC transporter permease [Paenibacillus]MCY9669184.1 ABC transporter permease [Paenibacillus alginolyticus]MCY9697435.1 ABC transporter permease [Paenibacillus alginolyticus]MEC0148468.1 ABC transporter permease [Paenibacillus alginolyticus]NRF95384.1 ABC transporter permease [Paenibacillus frigoriresistens]
MANYITYRVLQLIPLLIAISIIVFVIIQLPPGNFLDQYVAQLKNSGTAVSEGTIASLQMQYGLDKPMYMQYIIWVKNIVLHGDFGRSFQYNMPVADVIGPRLSLTLVISLISLIFVWIVAIPIGIYSATHQYSLLDYVFTFFGFIGLAMPGFLIALLLIYFIFSQTGVALTGLFSPDFVDAPWSMAKVMNMLPRLVLPVIVIGMSGTASLIRVTRGMLLDELSKQYVITARAKGVTENKLLFKYPVRMAINPLISTIGWTLPALISGEAIVAIVLNLQTTGPMLLKALMFQDMYLCGSFLLILSVLTVLGTLLSDILLALVDPRIRFGGVAE